MNTNELNMIAQAAQATQAADTLAAANATSDASDASDAAPSGPESELLPNGEPVFTFRASGYRIGKNALALGLLANELCQHLNQCNYAEWNRAREDFLAGAKAAGYLSDDIWDRAVTAAKGYGLKDKPKTPVVESAERDARRKAAQAEQAALMDGKTVAQLAAETEAAARAFSAASAAVAQAATVFEAAKTEKARASAAQVLAEAQKAAKATQDDLRKRQEARDKKAHDDNVAATKAASARLAELRKTLRELIPQATEAELIAAIKCIKVKAPPAATV